MHAARSGAVLAGITIAITVETLALHLLLRPHHPIIAWSLTVLSLLSLAWLAADYRAIGQRPLTLRGATLVVEYGLRVSAEIALSEIAAAVEPTWRDIPPRSPDYLKLSGFDDPNMLLRFRAPVRFRGPAGIGKTVTQLGLCVDDPHAFASALHAAGVPSA